MPKPSSDHPVLRAAVRWRDRCLLDSRSVFTEKNLWTSENVGSLVKYYAENLDLGEGSFFEKLEKQLDPAPVTAKQLAAELFWVMYLFPISSSMQPGTKRQQIRKVWEWSGEPLPGAPTELDEALQLGVGNPGTAYGTLRWKELLFFIRMMEAWVRLPDSQRKARLADPWNLAKWLEDQDETGTRQLRHILLYLLFPDQFEPIVTTSLKGSIVRAFARELGEEQAALNYQDRIALDRQILVIREMLQEKGAAPDFSFYDAPYQQVWRSSKGVDHEDHERWYQEKFKEARIWVLSPGEGARAWGEFQEKEIIAIGWDGLGDLRDYSSREAIHERLRELLGTDNPKMDSLACYQFAHEMKSGDHVIAKQGRSGLLGHGIITSEYEFRDIRSEFKHIRQIHWEVTGEWPLPKDQWVATKTLTNVSGYKQWLHFAFGLMEGALPPSPPPSEGELEPYTRSEAMEDLFLSEAKFDHIIDALERKKNVVLEGPPGVGKTLIAKRLAYRVIGYKIPERVRMIQFHQSYAYEDFIQGYRPRDDGGFKLRNGVFLSFCREAADNPDDRYVFIIDEVNRGNLGKIFGELMMLIEADKRGMEYAVPLTYSPDTKPFHVSANLYLIGMMNTADRSLAMVDYALRRRFAFIHLPPAFGTDEFSNFLNRVGVPEELVDKIVDRFSKLNEKIRADRANLGPGFEIGHSFFCPGDDDGVLDESWYEAVIRREIEPLLREYWFDRPDQVDREIRALLT